MEGRHMTLRIGAAQYAFSYCALRFLAPGLAYRKPKCATLD